MKFMASRRDLLGGIDNVPFVLAVFIVDEDDRLAELQLFEDFRNRRKWHPAGSVSV